MGDCSYFGFTQTAETGCVDGEEAKESESTHSNHVWVSELQPNQTQHKWNLLLSGQKKNTHLRSWSNIHPPSPTLSQIKDIWIHTQTLKAELVQRDNLFNKELQQDYNNNTKKKRNKENPEQSTEKNDDKNRQEKKQISQRNKGNVINDLPHGDAPGEEMNSNIPNDI